jgi:cell division protein FtsB
MDRDTFAFWLTTVSAACWIVCFWWMRRISSRQDALLAELREQTGRIESLSKTEHDLIREVHPQVGEIRETVERVATKVHAR